jgi:hypothetical protein
LQEGLADPSASSFPAVMTSTHMHAREICQNQFMRIGIACGVSFLFVLPLAAAQHKGAKPSNEPAQELARRVLANELKSEQQDHSHWMFLLKTYKSAGQSEVDQVIETKEGDIKRPVSINGRGLNEEQRKKADQQLQHLAYDPSELRKARSEEDEDTARSQELLKMLPDAFNFKYGQRRGKLVQLNFSPNPNFKPSTHEAEVFHAMQGSLWVDPKDNRLEEVNGRLIREVKFGGGILGHLDQGGTFDVKQAPVAPGYWELTLLHVRMKGKALFFKTIGVQQQYTRSNFKQVPDDLPLAKAAAILQEQETPTKTQAQKTHSPKN